MRLFAAAALALLLATGSSTAAPLGDAVTVLVPFATAPFPYSGQLPDGSGPFLDVQRDGRLGHTSPRGGIYWEDETYSDTRVLISVPAGFDPEKPAVIVVFFHGNQATLEHDVVNRQRVGAQVAASGLNAVLVAPQMAVNALDSSAGAFWTPGHFARFIDEAAARVADLSGISIARLPIIIVAYSGGYNPAAYVLEGGGVGNRVAGVILLDAAFGEARKFARWVAQSRGSAFFVSAYGANSSAGNAEIMGLLDGAGVGYSTGAPETLAAGTVAFIRSNAGHGSFVTQAFVANPLQWLLERIPGYAR
jgi:hypothetical protein